MARRKPIHKTIKLVLGYAEDEDDSVILADWKSRTKAICKPCWELKYCPYGPLVEDFPILPPPKDAIQEDHTQYLRDCLVKGTYGQGENEKVLDPERREMFERMVADAESDYYPDAIPKVLEEASCGIFGHLCPVWFTSEPFTETSKTRSLGRGSIPFQTKLRVARRDNYTCQSCGSSLKDDELEFDHIIPVAKGGSFEEHNLRLACFDCNRRKGAKVEI